MCLKDHDKRQFCKLEDNCNQVKDVLLPRQMQRAMASEAEADRDARAKVINMINMRSSGTFFVKVVAAEGEKKASLALKEASDIIDQSGYSSSTINQASALEWSGYIQLHQSCKKHQHMIIRSALQLRYLQTLSSIAAEKNSTIVFPVPLDLLGAMGNVTKK